MSHAYPVDTQDLTGIGESVLSDVLDGCTRSHIGWNTEFP